MNSAPYEVDELIKTHNDIIKEQKEQARLERERRKLEQQMEANKIKVSNKR